MDKVNPPFIVDSKLKLIKKLIEVIKNNVSLKKKSMDSKKLLFKELFDEKYCRQIYP